jgi:drug/metabolite transporter (DMT)-like permease
VPVDALALALAAAALHAGWNVLVAGAADIQATTAAALVVGVVAFAPVAVVTWRVTVDAIPFILASAAFEVAYFALLVAAYQRDDLSVVYPLTRGMAPVLVLAVSVAVLGLTSSVAEVAGVAVVAVGIVVVRGGQVRGRPRTFALMLAVAASIAGYTLVDRYGVQHANPLAYLELVLVAPAVVYAVLIGRQRMRGSLTRRSVAAGLASFGAYLLVLLALRLASAASVAAVRESSVVIAVALAAVVLREPVGVRRLGGAALVAGGVVLIAIA